MARDYDAAIRDFVPLSELVDGHERATRDALGIPAPLSVAAMSSLLGSGAFRWSRISCLLPRILDEEGARSLISRATRVYINDQWVKAVTAILVAASRAPCSFLASLAVEASSATFTPTHAAESLSRDIVRCVCLTPGLPLRSRRALARTAWVLSDVFISSAPDRLGSTMCGRMVYSAFVPGYHHAPSAFAVCGAAVARRVLAYLQHDRAVVSALLDGSYYRAPHLRDDGRGADPAETRAGAEFVRRRLRAAGCNAAAFVRWRAAVTAAAAILRRTHAARRAAGLRA